MKLHLASRFTAVTLICLSPVCVHAAGEGSGKAALSGEDLTTISEHIRQTGAQMREETPWERI